MLCGIKISYCVAIPQNPHAKLPPYTPFFKLRDRSFYAYPSWSVGLSVGLWKKMLKIVENEVL